MQGTQKYAIGLWVLAGSILMAQPSGLLKPLGPVGLSAGNGTYTVQIQNTLGYGVGLYTATTGPNHPSGEGWEVLYGRGLPGTSFTTVRSYTSGTDYAQVIGVPLESVNAIVRLDPYGTVQPLGNTGFRTVYELPGAGVTPDSVTILSDVKVNGISYADSTIEFTTTVINQGPTAVQIGIRYLWDFRVGNDDGPRFTWTDHRDLPWTSEEEFHAPRFEAFRLKDNDTINFAPPTYDIIGTMTGPAWVQPTPTPPDVLQFNCWASSYFTAFDYVVHPLRDVARRLFFSSDCRGTAGGDSAVAYYFGPTREKALVALPGGSVSVSASLFVLTPERSTVWR